MKRSHLVFLIILTVLLVVVAVLAFWLRRDAVNETRDQADEALFSTEATAAYTTLDGSQVTLSRHEGEIIIATSWASWCPQRAGELQLLNDLVGAQTDSRVKVVALNRMEPKHQAQRFMGTLPELPHITFVLDNQDYFFAEIEGYAMPETVFYNEAGEVVLHKRGNLTIEEATGALSAALGSD